MAMTTLPMTTRREPFKRIREEAPPRAPSSRRRRVETHGPLHRFFTGGIEVDRTVNDGDWRTFAADFETFLRTLGVALSWGRGVEFRLRRLGRHRADGLYYPEPPRLFIDTRALRSFAHEFGHLLDFEARRRGGARGRGGLVSDGRDFRPFREALAERLGAAPVDDPRVRAKRGRLSRRYHLSSPECFARAFEQFVAESLPQTSSLARLPQTYRGDPLYFAELPPGLEQLFRALLRAGA